MADKKDDMKLRCVTCNKDFIFTVRDQEFYAQNDFAMPKRCPECRNEAKKSKQRSSTQPKVPVGEVNESFDFDAFAETLEYMFSEFGFSAESDFGVNYVKGDKFYTFVVSAKNNDLAKFVLYNSGEVANYIRGYVKSVGRKNGYVFNIDIKKPA